MTATLTPDQLFHQNMRLVGSTLKRVKRDRNEMLLADDELTQVGYVALWRAARAFEHGRGVQFSTLACKSVFREIANEVKRFSYGKRGSGVQPLRESEYSQKHHTGEGRPVTLADIAAAPPTAAKHPADYARGRVMQVYKRAIASIKGEKWREIAIRRHLEGQDWPTIAKAFGYKSSRSLATMFNAKWREAILRRRRGARVSTAHMVRLERN